MEGTAIPHTNGLEFSGPLSANRRLTRVMGSTFLLDERYEIQEVLGQGAFGLVVRAEDKKTGSQVAIKKFENAFEHTTFAKRTLRELITQRILHHDQILGINSIQLPTSKSEFNDLYVVSELMEASLDQIIKSPQDLTDSHCQFFLMQILLGVNYMHSVRILHRDLKPKNILVNSNCDIKICDFGLARPLIDQDFTSSVNMTDYVATRWYRAPELLLSLKQYTSAMDMWSVGAIFGELLIRKPLLPGVSADEQLELIFNMFGTPSEGDILAIKNKKAKERVIRARKRRPNLRELEHINPHALDLLKQMMAFNPEKRITAAQALSHPYFNDVNINVDHQQGQPVSLFDFLFERQVLSMKDIKDLIYEEILLYHSSDKVEEYQREKQQFLESNRRK